MLTAPVMQPQRAPPNASASLAATKAFVRDRESNPNLSNAAAAAALRTHVTTPTPVGETVTKRMVRRNSASSSNSGAVQQRPGGLQRQSSSGSMTERTFRSPSPGRGPSPQDPDAPPVPAVPKDIPHTSTAHRRASSLEPAFRGASSPPPRRGGRGVSLDRGTGHTTSGRGPRATNNLAQVLEDDNDGVQRASVNFSRPMSPASAAKSGWFGGPVVNQDAVQRMASTTRPHTSSGLASAEVRNAQQTVQHAAERPVRTHQAARSVEGARLSTGSMRAKPTGTAVESRSFLPSPASRPAPGPVDPKSPDAVFDPSTRTFVHKQDAMARHRELNEEPEQPAQQYVAQHVEEHYSPRVPQYNPPPRTPSPVRRPLPREESPAVQKREHVALPRLDTSANIRRPGDPPTGIPKHDAHFEDAEQPSKQANTSKKLENTAQPTPIDVLVSPQLATNQDGAYPRLPVPTTTNTLARPGHGSVRSANDRGQSLSPPRNAHFAPVAVELAGIKHQPPPRSISPAKSALKSSPSVSRRGNSPASQNGRLLTKGTPSETSDTMSESDAKRKKRGVRVSFEEDPMEASTSTIADDETPTAPPPSGLGASKWSPTTEKEDDFEDFMRPRPALPSFGSIRDRERRSTPDEVAEKVTETVSSTPMTASVASIGEPLQASNDHAIAGIVAQDLAQKQARTNEPLPPNVRTVEGSGYVSDSSDEAEGLQKHGALDHSSQILPDPEPKSLTTSHEEKLAAPPSIKEHKVEVPDIALLPATPSPYEKPEPQFLPMAIPGGWNDEVLEAQEKTDRLAGTTTRANQPAPAVQSTQHPTNLQELVDRDEDSSDDNSSVYSDAYEDLTDAEGGFASIDAMVESPVAPSPSGLMFSKYADRVAAEPTSSGLRNETPVNDKPDSPTTDAQDWDATRQHWSSLNETRKKPQMDNAIVGDSTQTDDVFARDMTAPVKQEQTKPEPRIEPKPTRVQNVPSTPQSQGSQPSPRPLKSALKKTPVAQPAPPAQAQPQFRKTMRDQIPRDDRATATHMRVSMRGPPGRDARSAEPQMRKSMRGDANSSPREQPQMRTSMRGSSTATAGLAASRHSMALGEQKPGRAALQKKHIPAGAVAAKSRPQSMPAPMKQVASVPTYDSDSDASTSSFQRARGRRSGNQGARYTMRASMRQDAVPSMRTAAPAPKPVRSISPPGSPTPALRKSMRPSSPTPEVVKSSKFSIRSLSPMGRFRSSKPMEAAPPSPTQSRKKSGLSKQTKPKPQATERAKPAFKSRFNNSSDEDDDSRPSRFQSRFADSDSDEPGDYALPPGLAPVRGIPRKAGEEDGDSTDLEEEADDVPVPAKNKELGHSPAVNGADKGQSNGSTNGQGANLASGSLRDSKHAPLPSFEGGGKSKAKRGFFGLGKKKNTVTASQGSTVSAETSLPTVAPPAEIPLPPQQRNRDQGIPLTPIDEDKDIGASLQNSPQVNKSPKLQRRSTPEWPLPRNNIPVPPIPDDARPMSSDGIAPRRPRFQMRQSSQMSNVTAATAPIGDVSERSVSYGRTGKKKKFQGLRRVFGLND
jgi:serine/arginine repetitive matrix protein 2